MHVFLHITIQIYKFTNLQFNVSYKIKVSKVLKIVTLQKFQLPKKTAELYCRNFVVHMWMKGENH